MRPYQANLLNSAALILMPLWAYLTFEGDNPSMTAFTPLIFGVTLLLCSIGIKKENKIISHIAVLITFIALIGLTMPLKAAILDNRTISILRVAIMILTGFLAMFAFIKSFIQARRNR